MGIHAHSIGAPRAGAAPVFAEADSWDHLIVRGGGTDRGYWEAVRDRQPPRQGSVGGRGCRDSPSGTQAEVGG